MARYFTNLLAMTRRAYLVGAGMLRPSDTATLLSIPDQFPRAFIPIPPDQAPNGVRTVFTFPVVLEAIMLGNTWLFENQNYTRVGVTVTLPVDPATGVPVAAATSMRGIAQ